MHYVRKSNRRYRSDEPLNTYHLSNKVRHAPSI
jgi:hypothetical protein